VKIVEVAAHSLFLSAFAMLYLVGLGLSDETDITVKGLEIVKQASRVYLEAYTSILLVDQATLVRHCIPAF
jgi:diphthamide biosynthesis methyltransferase